MEFARLPKLRRGDKVAIVSPSLAAPALWPHVHELGLTRLRDVFGLIPVEFPTTRKLGATGAERATDLIAAFKDPSIKAVIATLGGDDQIEYVKHLPTEPFRSNPKPFFGYSDNTHFIDYLWRSGVPSFYGGNLFTEFAMQGEMDPFTVTYLTHALFNGGPVQLSSSPTFNEIGLDWYNPALLHERRQYQPNDGWFWDGDQRASGITWGGCLESIDELLRHGAPLPTHNHCEQIVLFLETSEEAPSPEYIFRVLRGLGERGILERVQGVLMGRPKAWDFTRQLSPAERLTYHHTQRETVRAALRRYNKLAPLVQNLDFGHTAPQICLPVGRRITISPADRTITADF